MYIVYTLCEINHYVIEVRSWIDVSFCSEIVVCAIVRKRDGTRFSGNNNDINNIRPGVYRVYSIITDRLNACEPLS